MKKLLLVFVLFAVACSETNDPLPARPLAEDELRDLIADRFPFQSNQTFEALYVAARQGSNLEWYFNFHEDGTLDVLFTTDMNQDFSFPGTYTYVNDQITIQMPAGPNMPFPAGLNETSTVIMPQFGLVAAFATDEMIAICMGHGLNSQAPPRTMANYGCPVINVQAASSEENAIELVHRSVPTEFAVAGSIFRQQDTHVQGAANPLVRRGYGIYRQTGNDFYATFRIASDFATFAQGQLPFAVGNVGVPFDDYNIISGSFGNNGQQLIVDQLSPEDGPCVLR
nr:hypothetical protein [uncultured Allomuricauda sp.]